MLSQAEYLRRSVRALDRYFERSSHEKVLDLGFTLPQMRVLREVVAHQGIGIKQLGQSLQMTQSTVSDIVDRLVDKGMLMKRVSALDKRAVEIWPAPDVEAFMANDRTEFVTRPVADLLQGLEPTQRDMVLEGIRLLMARLAAVQGTQA